MGGVTHKIEEAVKALEKGQVKKALWLTDTTKTQRHHEIVEDAARKCLSDRDQCSVYFKDAAQKLSETITAPLDETDLEGVEEMIGESEKPEPGQPEAEKSDEELYAACPDCHVADAVVKFHEISEHCLNEAVTQRIERVSEDQNTTPEKWIKTMKQVAKEAECGKEAYAQVLGELTEYLESKGGVFLNNLDKE